MTRKVEENIHTVEDCHSPDIRIVDLSLKRKELALKCRFQKSCFARSKNCHTCPKKVGLSYSIEGSLNSAEESWEAIPNGGIGTHSPAPIYEMIQNPIRRG